MLVQEPESVSQEKFDTFAVSRIFCLYSQVFLWVATAYKACLSLDEVNGTL